MPASVIQPLSPLTIQKIAAGEVIERPANVVKELVENALDAGATKVSIALEDGGKELIRVADNGTGMNHEDALRCWLPHTTSKIRALEDLETVSSFGFRGEALASMAAVAEFTVETRHWEEEIGTRLRVVESRPETPEDIARNPGTTISIRNLFRHNPVRRKFLASGKSETTRITNLLTRLSLAHPNASFRLSEGNHEVLHLPEGTLRRRAADVLGAHVMGDLIEVDWEEGGIHIQGYVSEPQRFSNRANQQHFFVNRRHVYSGLFTRALAHAYEVAPPGRFPVAALFLSVDPAGIDVNIHPTKREIRFLNESRIFWALSQALRRALRNSIAAPSLELNADALPPSDATGMPAPFVFSAAATEGESESGSGETSGVQAKLETANLDAGNQNPTLLPLGGQPRSLALGQENASAPCLQIHHSFILVAVQSGFLLVNQQAAHERILYEKALAELRHAESGPRFSAQQLLFPELMELTGPEARLVGERLAELRALGFDLEPFGATAFQLRGLPGEVSPEQAQPLLQALIARLLDCPRNGEEEGPDKLRMRIAMAYARSAAIALGTPLEGSRMAALIDGLFATQNPYVAPNGAPVVIRYSLDEIRRRFGLKAAES